MSTDTRRSKDEWLSWVASQPPSAWGPPEGKSVAVLYSGYQGQSSHWAKEDCAAIESPRYCIEQTTAGKELDDAKLYKSELSGLSTGEADQVWAAASSRFAQNIEGPVETQILSSDKNAIARGTELPMVDVANTRVTTINGIDRAELADMSRTDAYYAICKSEITQTQQRAAQAEDPELAKSLGERAEQKEVGLQALIGRDMAWNAQHSADPVTAPDEKLTFREGPPREGTLQVPPPANDFRRPEHGVQVGDNAIPAPANDNYRTPSDIPSPNEFSPPPPAATGNLQPPGDGVPTATTAPPIANDNSISGP
jgi:hypothetical protein